MIYGHVGGACEGVASGVASNQAKGNIKSGPRLSQVVMPIIRAMNADDMSWSDREECAAAILSAYRHWKSMEDERLMHTHATCASQQMQGKIK